MSARRLTALLLAAGALAVAPAAAQHFGHEGGSGAHDVSMSYSAFSPEHVSVLTGDSVTWRNDSVRVHTVTARDESFDSGRVTVGQTFTRRFDSPGAVPYFCRLHTFGGEVDVHDILLDAPEGAVGSGREIAITGRSVLGEGAEVAIERDAGQGFAPFATTSADAGGAFRATVTPEGTAVYRAVSGERSSPPVRIVVLDRKVTVRSAAARGRAIVRASVTPSSPGATAVLQLRLHDRFGWWPAARTRLDRHSHARFAVALRRFHVPRGRSVRARVVLTLPDDATATAVSRTFRVRAR